MIVSRIVFSNVNSKRARNKGMTLIKILTRLRTWIF
jgi:hypothetical protein